MEEFHIKIVRHITSWEKAESRTKIHKQRWYKES